MKVTLMTRTPALKGLLGPVPEEWAVTEIDAESVEVAVDGAACPVYGEVRGVRSECVVTSRSTIVRVRQ